MGMNITKPPVSVDIPISTEFIRLEAFLKLSGAAETGGQAKNLIQSGLVTVDGKICTARGKKLLPGTEVSLEGGGYRVVSCESTG